MKRKISLILGAVAIAIALTINVKLAETGNSAGLNLDILLKKSLAFGCNGGGAGGDDCPGGSCTYTEYVDGKIQWSCSACCPQGKSPRCSYVIGCDCF